MKANKINWENGKFALIVLLIAMLVFFTLMFWKGIHNIDLIYNFQSVANQINEKECYNKEGNLTKVFFFDKASDFIERPLEDYYITGMNQLERAFIGIFLSSLFLGVLLSKKWKTKK